MSATVTEVVDPVAGSVEPPVNSWRLTLALARIEARRLLRSPLVLGGFAFGFLPVLGSGPWVAWLDSSAADNAFLCLMLAATTLVAANLAALRPRRHGTEELVTTTPAPPGCTTAAHLLSIVVPVAMALVVIGATVATDVFRRRGYGQLDLAELAVGPALVAGAGALGVLLARWVPFVLAGPVTCVAIAVFEGFVNSSSLVVAHGWQWMGFWVQAGDFMLMPRPSRWHLVYLAGLVAMAAVGAMARHGVSRRLAMAGTAAIAVTAVAAAAQVASPSSQKWAERNALLATPDAHQVCEVHAGVRFCAFPSQRPLIEYWAAVVAGVRANVPASEWPEEMAVTQRITPGDLRYTPQELKRVLPDLPSRHAPLPDDGDVHPGKNWTIDGETDLSLGLGVASRAVGLPLAPPAPETLCDVGGQGRAVVALWLAARSSSSAATALANVARRDGVLLNGRPFLVLTEDAVQKAVAWGMPEVHHALALLDRPAAEVRALVSAQWGNLTDPATTTAEVARLFRLAPAPAVMRVPDRTGSPDLQLGPPCVSRT